MTTPRIPKRFAWIDDMEHRTGVTLPPGWNIEPLGDQDMAGIIDYSYEAERAAQEPENIPPFKDPEERLPKIPQLKKKPRHGILAKIQGWIMGEHF